MANGKVYNTMDKSNQFSADSSENYILSMQDHIKEDKTITEHEVAKLEKVINCHTNMFRKLFKIGSDLDHEDRVKSAVTQKEGPVPKLRGHRKTHKEVPEGQEVQGPPMRTLCGASRSINGPLSNILSEILNKVADNLDKDVKTECRSTEEMVAGIECVNQKTHKDLVTCSMDVAALYPNLKAKIVAREIAAAFLKSELEIEVDTDQLGLYLLLVLAKEEVAKQGLSHVCPSRKATAGSECGTILAAERG